MPTTEDVGTPGPNNDKIGGVPIIHYFDFQSKGRGQVIRLLCEDAGIAYKDVRYSFDEYPAFKEGPMREMNPAQTFPIVELNGRFLTQSYAVLRKFSRELGAYDGTTNEDVYLVDLLNDLAADWRTQFVTAFLSPTKDKDYPEFQRSIQPPFLRGVEGNLRARPRAAEGPFALGAAPTYADLVLYQDAHDAGLTKDGCAGLREYPTFAALCAALEARPNVKAFLGSDRYRG